MVEHPLDDTLGKTMKDLQSSLEKATKDLQGGIDNAMLNLQQGMQKYLANSIDLSKLLKMIERMGLPNIIGMKAPTMPGMDFYKVLGLEKTASNNEIKERYKVIMGKLHPDIAGEEVTFLAALVNTAYGIICKERGI